MIKWTPGCCGSVCALPSTVQSDIGPYVSRWYSAIGKRRSRRQFDPARPIHPDLQQRFRTFCAGFRLFSHARAVLVTESPDSVFKGAVGPYGKIKNAPAFVAFIGDMSSPNVQEEIGYTGEGIVLEATASHLATCWVGGFFRPEVAAPLAGARENERVLAVTPVGYAQEDVTLEEKLMTGFGRTHNRHPLSHLTTGLAEQDWPEWARASLQAARLAPSAVNRQPWGFHVEPRSITVYVRTTGPEFDISKRLDCGISMLHIELGALSCGISVEWELLEHPQVARLTISSATETTSHEP